MMRPEPNRPAINRTTRRRVTTPFWFMVLAAGLAGCGIMYPWQDKGAELKAARQAVEDSREDYQLCVRDQEEVPETDCEIFKDIYEEDKDAYENIQKRQKALGL